jgi:hypothetical protein
VKEVMSDPDAEFNPAAGESLVMIPLTSEVASSHHGVWLRQLRADIKAT